MIDQRSLASVIVQCVTECYNGNEVSSDIKNYIYDFTINLDVFSASILSSKRIILLIVSRAAGGDRIV